MAKPKRKEVAWSPQMAYAIGLIASDGCLSRDGRHLLFVSKDIEQILNLKKCLGIKAEHHIHITGRKDETETYYRLQWSDVTLYNFLLGIGITVRKSLTIGALNIPDSLFFDFLRGVFDGDGSFYSYFDPRWPNSFMFYTTFTSASRNHIAWLQENIERLAGAHGHITKQGKGHMIFNLRFAKSESLILLRYLYTNLTDVCLSRKKLKIQDALRIVGKSLQET